MRLRLPGILLPGPVLQWSVAGGRQAQPGRPLQDAAYGATRG